MNAHAHLLSLGWAGPGHSLDSRPNSPGSYKQKGHRGLAYDPSKDPLKVGNTGNGLVKPLLVSHRKNRFGIGKKAHEAPAGNEWWLKGFESALGNIGKSESERSSGTSTPVTSFPVGKHGGLYSFFIQGQIMQGTIEKELLQRTSRKRKSDEFEDEDEDAPQLNPRPTSPKKPPTVADFAMVGAFMEERDKGDTKRSKMEKAGDADQFAQIGEFFDVVGKPRSKRKPEALNNNGVDNTLAQHHEQRVETKEERRERRRRRKEEQASRVGPNGAGEVTNSEDLAAKATRRAERQRRKEEEASKKR